MQNDCIGQRSKRKGCLYARVNGVTNNSVGVNIFDGAEMELVLPGSMLRDIGELEFASSGCSKVTFNEIIMNWWTRFYSHSSFLGKNRPDLLLRAEFPHSPLTGFDSGIGEFIADEPIPECRVIVVDVISGVDEVGIGPFSQGERVLLPLIEGLFTKTEHPAGHRNRHPDEGIWRSQFKDQRVDHFGMTSLER